MSDTISTMPGGTEPRAGARSRRRRTDRARRSREPVRLAAVLGLAVALGGAAAGPPVPAEDLGARVHALLAEQHWREALELARQGHADDPADPLARSLLGEALFRAGRFSEAEAMLAGVERRPGASGRALLTLGRLRDAQGRSAEAVGLARRAVAASPDDREVLFRAADVTATRAEAIDLLRRYLERSEGDAADRIESARGSLALFQALGERAIWTSESRPERLELPLEPLWVHETGEVIGYVVRVLLGGRDKPVALLLDSGSPGLFVLQRIARKRGFEPLAEVTVFGGGGEGRHATRRGFFSRLALGGLEFGGVLSTAAPGEIDPVGRFHGLLGLSAFHGYRLEIDLARRRLLLESAPEEAPDDAPYFTIGGQLLVEARTTGDRSGLFLLDTGATRSLVSEALVEGLEAARVGGPASVRAFGGLRRDARVLDGFEVRFQGQTTGAGPLRAADLSRRSAITGVEVAGFLGLDLLGGKRIVIDTVHRRLRVEPARSPDRRREAR